MSIITKYPIRAHKQVDEDIDPWKAEEMPQYNGIEYPTMGPYSNLDHHTISFNPEYQDEKQSNRTQKKFFTRNNFVENLRRYEQKKAEQIKNKYEINFI